MTVLPVSPPQHPVIDGLADMPCFDPFGAVEIGDGAGDGKNPIAGIGIEGEFGNGRLEQSAAVVTQFQGFVAGLGFDLLAHFGQASARRPHFPFGRTNHFDADVGFRQFPKMPLNLPVAANTIPAWIVPIPARARPDLEAAAKAEFQSNGPQHGLAAIRRADEKDRMVPSNSDHQGPFRHFVFVDDAGGIVAVGGGLGTSGDFVDGLAMEGRQFAVGEGEEIHAVSFGLGSLVTHPSVSASQAGNQGALKSGFFTKQVRQCRFLLYL